MKKFALSMFLILSIFLASTPVFAGTAFDYEHNNTPDEAFVINDDSNVVSTISQSDDNDYYKFTVSGSVYVDMSLISPEGVDYDIKLYNADYNEVASSELPAGSVDLINKKYLTSGTYSIRIYCFDKNYSASPYTLTFKTSGVKGPKLGYAGISESEVENTTLKNALEVNCNTSFRAKLSSLYESRYYKIVLDNPYDMDISMVPPEDADLDMVLYNSTGLEVGKSANKYRAENISVGSLFPGTYYLKVFGSNFDYSANTYEVSIKSFKTGTDKGQTIDDGKTTANGSLPKALLLYVGPGLTEYSDKDIKKMLIDDPINTKEFIITDNGAQYNTYINSEGKLADIVTPEKINALTIDNVDSTGTLDLIKKDYLSFYKYAEKQNSLDYFSDKAVNLALKLIKTDSNVKIYIAIPGVNFHALNDEYIEPVKEKLLKGIKDKLDKVNPDYWNKNIVGFYFSTEGIPYYYSWFKPDKSIDFNNPVVKTMSSLSNEIHQAYNKKFVWIPYYGNSLEDNNYYNKNQYVRAGYIANRTDIFDYVILQPSYYFNAGSNNIPFVKASAEKNIVLDTDQNIIGGIKNSRTIIGAEMEIDHNCMPTAGSESAAKEYQGRYKEYLSAFRDVSQKAPVAFYAGSRDDLFNEAVYSAVKSFFKAINR